MLVTEADAESYKDRVEVIELATKRSLIVLSDPERSLTGQAMRAWIGPKIRNASRPIRAGGAVARRGLLFAKAMGLWK